VPNVIFERLTFLLHILKMQASNVGLESDGSRVSLIAFTFFMHMLEKYLVHTRFLPFPFQFSINPLKPSGHYIPLAVT
jgi:hypothetical protein